MIRPARALYACYFSFLILALPALAEPDGAARTGSRSVQMAESAFTRGDAVPAWVDDIGAIPAAAKDSPLAIRLADVQFYVDQKPAVYAHRALTANEAASLSALGQYEISFQPEYQRLQLHTLRILRGNQVIDKLQSADVRFLQREANLDQGLYSGSITAAIVTDDVRVGDTLEMAYTISGHNPVFGGKFYEAAGWDSPSPISLRRVSIDMPEQRTIYHRLIGGSGKDLTPAETRRNGRRILRFETRGLQALLGEPYVPSDVQAYRWIQFSELNRWSDVNQWALGLFDTSANAAFNDALRTARQASTPQDKVAKVLEFVQNDIRYLSLSMGENSHRPYPPAQVLQRRYGDCKDKTLLMVTMLRELGIAAQPVLVSTYYRKGLDQMLPSPILFDHAIVRAEVQGKIYYFDPTRLGQYGKLDRMGQVHGGAQVLAIAPATTALETVPQPSDPTLYTDKRSEQVVVTAFDQPAEMQARLEYAGAEAERARVQLANMTSQQLRKAYEGSMGRRYTDFSLLDEPKISDDRINNKLAIDLRYRINKFFEKEDRSWMLRYKPSNMLERFYVPDMAKREQPLLVPAYPAIHTYDFEVKLPDNVDAHYKPSQSTIAGQAFTLGESMSFSGRTVQVNMQLEITKDRVAAADVPEFVGKVRKAGEAMQGSMYVRPEVFKTAAALPYKEAMQQRLDSVLKATSRVVADAALTGQDAGGAWCERARVRAWLGMNADALKDAAKAVQQDDQAAGLRCYGDVTLVTGNFKESAGHYARAVALGSDDGDTWLSKGWADLYLGNKRDALNDFTRALKASDDPQQRLRVQIWQAMLGSPSAANTSAAPASDNAWLSAALEMFQSQQPPDQMLRLASREGADGLEPRLVEAYFYAGRYYLQTQDKLRAKVYFQRAVDKGALNNIHHHLARHELARLQ